VELSAADYKQVKSLQERGLAEDDEDAIRSAVMAWFVRNRTEPNPFTVPM
jgi:hypothetical protein